MRSKRRRRNVKPARWRTQADEKPLSLGARMGSFAVKIGDSVLLKSPEQGKVWVGLICAFSEADEDGDEEMCAHIQWFASPEELAFGQRSKTQTRHFTERVIHYCGLQHESLDRHQRKSDRLVKGLVLEEVSSGTAAEVEVGCQSICEDHHVSTRRKATEPCNLRRISFGTSYTVEPRIY